MHPFYGGYHSFCINLLSMQPSWICLNNGNNPYTHVDGMFSRILALSSNEGVGCVFVAHIALMRVMLMPMSM